MLQHPFNGVKLPRNSPLVLDNIHPAVVAVVKVDIEPLDKPADLVLELVSLLQNDQKVGVELFDDPAV